jgi:hypothetical protein
VIKLFKLPTPEETNEIIIPGTIAIYVLFLIIVNNYTMDVCMTIFGYVHNKLYKYSQNKKGVKSNVGK